MITRELYLWCPPDEDADALAAQAEAGVLWGVALVTARAVVVRWNNQTYIVLRVQKNDVQPLLSARPAVFALVYTCMSGSIELLDEATTIILTARCAMEH